MTTLQRNHGHKTVRISREGKPDTHTFSMTESEARELSDEYAGFCLACGDQADGVEPDARRYECANCGESRVYGLEELALMGRITFTEGGDE